MIIKGASRRSIAFWSRHLMDDEKNTRAELVEKRGLAEENLRDMMSEMQEDARLTRAKNFMYIASLNPCAHERLTEQQWEQAYEIFEKHRGIPPGQQRIVIEHEKNGRTHRHVVWNRIDTENMRAFPDGLDLRVCEAAEKEIERELGLERTPHLLDREPGAARPQPGPKSWEMYRGQRSELDPRDVTAEVTAIFRESENAADFVAGLRQHSYELVTGNRAFCVLDSAGDIHSLARRIEGINTRELKAFMKGLDLSGLPTVEQAKAEYQERKIAGLEADRATVQQQIEWEEKVAAVSIEKEKTERRFVEPKKEPRAGGQQEQRPVAAPELGRTAGEIRLAYGLTDSGQAFADALEDRGLLFARVTALDIEKLDALHQRRIEEEEAARLQKLSYLDQRTAEAEKAVDPERVAELQQRRAELIQKEAEAKPWMSQKGGVETLNPEHLESAQLSYNAWEHKNRYSFRDYVSYTQERWQENNGQQSKSRFQEGDLVVINAYGEVFGLSLRNTGDDYKTREEYLKNVNRAALPSVIEAWAVLKDVHQHRRDEALWLEQEKHWPIYPPRSGAIKTSPRYWFDDAARSATYDERPLDAPADLKGRFSAIFKDQPEAAHIWEAYNRNRHDPKAFANALEENSILLSAVTKEEAEISHRQSTFSKEIGHYNPNYREQEIVAVGPSGRVYKLNDRTTGEDRAEVERFLKKLDRTQLKGVEATKQIMHERAEAREAYAQLMAIVNPVKPANRTRMANDNAAVAALGKAGHTIGKALDFSGDVLKSPLAPEITIALGKTATRAVGKTLDMVGGAVASLFAPILTPEQKLEGEITARERQAEAEHQIDFSNYTADRAIERQKQEQAREPDRPPPQREDRER